MTLWGRSPWFVSTGKCVGCGILLCDKSSGCGICMSIRRTGSGLGKAACYQAEGHRPGGYRYQPAYGNCLPPPSRTDNMRYLC